MNQVSYKVNRSIELPDGSKCVDIFENSDGVFGFEEYRRDFETNSGWFPIGNYCLLKWKTEKDAFEAAIKSVPWLKSHIGDNGL